MFPLFRRNPKSALSNWWWTVDKVLLFDVLALIAVGVFLITTASPAVARRIGLGGMHFVKRQIVFIPAALALMGAVSMMGLKSVRRLAVVGFAVAIILTMLTLFLDMETKGASRWLRLFGFSLQPSEFIKPCFAVVAAWLFDGRKKNPGFPGNLASAALFGLSLSVLLLQPDVGMSLVLSAVWGFQFFLAGLSLWLVAAFAAAGVLGAVGAYFAFDHVRLRVDDFLAGGAELSYQVKKSLQAFGNGGLFGRGPGEGTVKMNIPDAHTDFIFSVAGEEFGLVLCSAIVVLFAVIVIRPMLIALKENNLFVALSAAGLAASLGLQAIVNMASSLHLMPTKGMTLPFVSYGGSSLLAASLGMGMLLAITRKNVSAEEKDEL